MSGLDNEIPRFSVIVPAGRGAEAVATIGAVAALPGPSREIIVVGAEPPPAGDAVFVAATDLNPARRRNAAVAVARGEILAFIDDDAIPNSEWLVRADRLFDDIDVSAVGGVDPGPPDAPLMEKVSDTLLAAPVIGSGVAAHERRSRRFRVRRPHDVALVNLFVRASAYRQLGGLNEAIGYIGEDSDLVARLISSGQVWFDPELIVHHRRRRFPGAYLRQRFMYRRKMGQMLARGQRRPTPAIVALLLAPLLLVAGFAISPALGFSLLSTYAIVTVALGGLVTDLPLPAWPLLPVAFALHHLTYLAGLVVGLAEGLAGSRAARARADHA